MKGKFGNLWDCDGIIVVPTNCVVRRDGKAVMGAGVAKQAAEKHPALPAMLGRAINCWTTGPQVEWFEEIGIVCLPTKDDWRDKADIELIRSGCQTLREIAIHCPPDRIYLPPLGCGLGGLNWKKQVRPLLVAELPGEQFVCVAPRGFRG